VLHILYTSPNIISVIKPRMMKWVGHAARMGSWEVRKKISLGAARRKGKMVLKQMLKKY